jgi:hypothetical protein
MSPESYGEWELHCRKEAEKNIGFLIQRAHKEGVKAHKVLLQGLADDAIIEAAERLGSSRALRWASSLYRWPWLSRLHQG